MELFCRILLEFFDEKYKEILISKSFCRKLIKEVQYYGSVWVTNKKKEKEITINTTRKW